MSTTKTILILSASPRDKARLRLDEEVREIDEGLRRAKHGNRFIIQSKWAVRLRDLRRALLDYDPQIVHFCGHGEKRGILLEDNDGNAVSMAPNVLAELFELFADTVECVLLNACYSESQAEAISMYIQHVIGMREGILDKTAIEFAVGFYDALGAGRSIEDSFKFGQHAIKMYNLPEQLIPILKQQPRTKISDTPVIEVQQTTSKDDERQTFLINGTPVSDLHVPRGSHIAIKLQAGKVAIIGGILEGKMLPHIEIFDPIQTIFIPGGSLKIGRAHNGAALLDDGTVFVVGDNGRLTQAEIYNPTTKTSTLTHSKTVSFRDSWFSITVLPDKRILLAGSGQGNWSRKTEIYDPVEDSFIPSFDLLSRRMVHTATLLQDGTVLIAGDSKRAELFDVSTGSFHIGDMCIARRHHTATLLPNGNVLIIGGKSVKKEASIKEAEVFDARSKYFELTDRMELARWGHTATCLLDGRVVVVGGFAVSKTDDMVRPTDLIEIYEPRTHTFHAIGRLKYGRAFHSATLLDNGSLLIVGGVEVENNFQINNLVKTAEVIKFY